NWIARMVKWEDQGKVRPQDHAFVRRLETEGWEIDGRPPTRRTVTKEIVIVDGKQMIKKTILELDGTTKVFMVPFVSNFSQYRTWHDHVKDEIERLKAILLGGRATSQTKERQPPPNPWMQPAF